MHGVFYMNEIVTSDKDFAFGYSPEPSEHLHGLCRGIGYLSSTGSDYNTAYIVTSITWEKYSDFMSCFMLYSSSDGDYIDDVKLYYNGTFTLSTRITSNYSVTRIN